MKKLISICLLLLILAISVTATKESKCDKILTKQNLIQEKINTLENLSWDRTLTKKETRELNNLRVQADRLYSRYVKCTA